MRRKPLKLVVENILIYLVFFFSKRVTKQFYCVKNEWIALLALLAWS
jgi:hypothetical protein